MPFSFEVSTFVMENPTSALLGFCDLIIDGKLVIKGFKVFKSKSGDKLFIGAPSQPSKKTDENGKTIYYETVSFVDQKEKEDDYHTPFQTEVYKVMLDAFEEAQSAGPTRTSGGGTKTKTPETGNSPNAGPPRAPRNNPLWSKK